MPSDTLTQRLQSQVGTTVGEKYRLDALLGIGGMAAVYAATHRNGDRVALKVLHLELARMRDVRARFLREGYAANKVGHRGVVRVLDDVEQPDGLVFLVMDLLEGQTLEQRRLDCGGRLELEPALLIIREVLDIVAAAHVQRIVHRDIKPDNIFLTRDGDVRLMDFGIARLLDSATVTGSGAVMGTPAFMSPEQAGGQNKIVDAPADVWSLGAVMFQLLTGEDVHRGRTSTEQLIYAATTPARKIDTVLPSLPTGIAEVIDTALAFEIRGRFQSAGAMANALGHVIRQHGLPDSQGSRQAAAALRQRVLVSRPDGGATQPAPAAATVIGGSNADFLSKK